MQTRSKGSKKPDYVFVVMPLLGKDLHKLQHEQITRRFSLSTSIFVAMQTLAAIEELHTCGFISRDIKPSNFAIGRYEDRQHRTIFLLDFGLAKRYLDIEGKHHPSRGEVGWRGTTRYGSLKAHQKLDLGRRDDLESWFYFLVEITSGALPWRCVNERSIVQASKLMARQEGRAQFLHDCPRQYDDLLTIIDSLVFQDKPQYELIQAILNNIREENGIDAFSRFDWEEEDSSSCFNGAESTSVDIFSLIGEPDMFIRRTENSA
uniref:Protein kinase domain-containing protein n=1 Tax=Parascaris univalens TaxID=6257 RepID=A0A915ARE9_PARUN